MKEEKYAIILYGNDLKNKIKNHARLNGMSISSFVSALLSVIFDDENTEMLIAILKKAQEHILSQYALKN